MKKRVNIYCGRPFNIGNANFAGVCLDVILDVNDIAVALMNKSKVEEIMDDGSLVKLGFDNYTSYNGVSTIDEGRAIATDRNHFVSTLNIETLGEEVKEQPMRVVTKIIKPEDTVKTEEVKADTSSKVVAKETEKVSEVKADDSVKVIETSTTDTTNTSTDASTNSSNSSNKFNKYNKKSNKD